MGWADNYIKKLQSGETIQFRPRGNSMTGKIESGQLVTVKPFDIETGVIWKNSIVLCKVAGKQYLHLVTAVGEDSVQISNNKGHVNGWTKLKNIYGVVIKVE